MTIIYHINSSNNNNNRRAETLKKILVMLKYYFKFFTIIICNYNQNKKGLRTSQLFVRRIYNNIYHNKV